jgi:flavin reductase (DIM6/NTAB) family NADH-FMN oxidoreductase RutF
LKIPFSNRERIARPPASPAVARRSAEGRRRPMKKELGVKNCTYPMPVTIVGATVEGRPNYLTIAHVGIMDFSHVSVSMGKIHYTNAGIKSNGTFSVNIPSVELVRETDYCGLVSGRKFDKAAVFETFYGKLGTAPMITQCPLNMECRLAQTVDMPNHDVFIGEIVEAYCDEQLATEGDMVDFTGVRPILFAMYDKSYFELGERFADAWSVGKELIG